MQQHIYSATNEKIFKQSFFIWLWVITHIGLNVYIGLSFFHREEYWLFFVMNLMLLVITLPSIYIFFNYLKYTIHKDFIVTYEEIKLVDRKTNETVQIKNKDIVKVELYDNRTSYKAPWSAYEYFCFIDKENNRIVVTSHIMSISDFWLDTLVKKISSNKLIIIEDLFPVIKNNY
jgi:hypothetical protein